jgi:hypothetical protein
MEFLIKFLPEEVIERISMMLPVQIPDELFNKIMLYNSHPVADLFKESFKSTVIDMNEIIPGDYEHGGEDFCHADTMSFAHYLFHNEDEVSQESRRIYYYAHMDRDYVSTLNEFLRN